MTTRSLILDMAKVMPTGFIMYDLLKKVREAKPQTGDMILKNCAWSLVTDGLIVGDGEGGLKLAESRLKVAS